MTLFIPNCDYLPRRLFYTLTAITHDFMLRPISEIRFRESVNPDFIAVIFLWVTLHYYELNPHTSLLIARIMTQVSDSFGIHVFTIII